MDTPQTLTLGPRPELSLEQIVAYLDASVAEAADLRPRIAGADLISDIYAYLTNNSLGKWAGMLAVGGLGTYIGTQFGDANNNTSGNGIAIRTDVGNLGSYIGGRFATVDATGVGISINVTDKANALGAQAGTLNQIVLSQVQGTGANLGNYIGQQLAGTNANVNQNTGNLGTYVGQQFAVSNSQAAQQASSLGQYIGATFATLPPHVDNTVGNATNWLGAVVNAARDAITDNVAVHLGQNAIDTVGGIVQGAADLGGFFLDGLKWLVDGAFDSFEGLFGKRVDSLHKLMRADYASMEEIVNELDYGVRGGSIVSMIESVMGGVFMIPPLIGGIGQAYAETHVQEALKITTPTMLSLTALRDGWLRGLVDDNWLEDNLSRYGFNADNQAAMRALFFEPAPPSDLVRFLVREVFDPQQRQSLQLDGDYPAAADAEARKVGLSPETMRNYWAAHWQLPSPGQVYEMLHRGLINAAQVDAYLKAADYSPAWRGNLANISYNVPGRIDLRRMYAAGVINEDRVFKGYKDLGYDDDNAGILTRFAKSQATGATKELPRGVILEGYREGSMDRASATAHLQVLGFTPPEAAFMLDLEDLTNARELQNLNEDGIEADFKAGIVNEQQVLFALNGIGVPVRRAQLLVNKWRSRHAVKSFTLTVSQIQQAVREQLIPDSYALQRFAALNVNPGDANLLLALAHAQSPPDAPATLSEAQLFRALREGLLNQAQLADRLLRRGHTPDDVRILVELATPDQPPQEPAELTKAELIAAAKKDILPIDAVQRRLAARGYSAQDVDTLMKNAGFEFTPTGQLVSYPRRDLTVAQLSKSFREALIDEKQLRFRLAELTYAEEDIDLLVELATPAPPEAA